MDDHESISVIPLRVSRIAHLTLNVHDLNRVGAFYVDALGFSQKGTASGRVRLTRGAQEIVLVQRAKAGSYPTPRAANDPWFQHFAIAVSNMDAAYAHLSRFAPEPITNGGPQLLPPSTGSVTAYKFRDPEGHPLELSLAPESPWSRGALADHDAVFLGIDHTALATRDLEASIAFYAELGFSVGSRSLNQGPEQERLDGLEGATVDIVTLLTPEPGPHIELLSYRSPAPPAPRIIAPDDIAATRTVLDARPHAGTTGPGSPERRDHRPDPDGHLLQFAA